jgi:hypothetical protein
MSTLLLSQQPLEIKANPAPRLRLPGTPLLWGGAKCTAQLLAPRAGTLQLPGPKRTGNEKTGIGRATLYKYFPDVESILFAWHERQITGHLKYLAEVRDQAGSADDRLEAVLEAFALISHESHGHHNAELAAFLHRDEQTA